MDLNYYKAMAGEMPDARKGEHEQDNKFGRTKNVLYRLHLIGE